MESGKPPKSQEQADFEESIRNSTPIFDTKGFYWRFMFGWVDSVVSAARRWGLTLDMLPNLSHEFQHRNYSNKIRHHFHQLIREHKYQKKEFNKYFILHLLFRSFKYDMLLTLFFVTLLTIMEYSSPFFLFKILSIAKDYDETQHLEMFIKFSVGLVVTKAVNSILNDNVYFQMVG
jgi:hypothetical protein